MYSHILLRFIKFDPLVNLQFLPSNDPYKFTRQSVILGRQPNHM